MVCSSADKNIANMIPAMILRIAVGGRAIASAEYGGKRRAVIATESPSDPSGCAEQEDFDEVAASGFASM
jgi:hypothetical protein